MPAQDISNTWENIRQGVKEAEILIGQKQYNLSMVKSRQVLEIMTDYLCANAAVEAENLADAIDILYSSEWIDKATCEHYHKIRLLGNKAVHEGNDNAYDANQAYHLLSQEVYTFANEYKSKKGRSGGRNTNSRNSGGRNTGGRPAEGPRSTGRRSSGARSRRRQPADGFSMTPTDIARLVLILVFVAAIALVVRLLHPAKSDTPEDESTTPVETVASLPETFATESQPLEAMPETTPAPVYKTTSSLNVRSEPSTAGERLGLLEAGTIIDYVEDYDDEWTIINYNGTQAYVNSQYLTHD